MDIDRLRYMCRQGDVEALDELVRFINRRDMWPLLSRNMLAAIRRLLQFYFRAEFSFPHTVELIHQLMVGVPLLLTAASCNTDWRNLENFPESNRQAIAMSFLIKNGFPNPSIVGNKAVSFFTKKKGRGIPIFLPGEHPSGTRSRGSGICHGIKNLALREMKEAESAFRYDCSILLCSSHLITLEFLPEKGCEKTPLVHNTACGKKATTERRGCWEWDGREWRRTQ